MNYPYQNGPAPPQGMPPPSMYYGPYHHGHPHPQPPPLVAPLAQQPHYPPMQIQDPNQYPQMPQIYHHHNLFPSQMPYPPPQHYFTPQFQPAPRFHPHPQQHQHSQQIHRPYVPQPPRPVPPPQQPPHHLPPVQQMAPRPGSLPPQEQQQHHVPQNTSYPHSPRTTPVASTSSQPVPQVHAVLGPVTPAPPVKVVLPPPVPEPGESEEPEEPLQKVTSPTVAAAPVPPSPPSPQSPTSVLSASSMNNSSYHVLPARPRLTDPSFRFAISYSARPPTTILEKALPAPPGLPRKMRTKRIVRRRVSPSAGTPVAAPVQSTSNLSSTSYLPPATPASSSSVCRVSFSKESPTTSSSVTETTPATSITHTPTPGSPLSTNTSISSMATPSSTKIPPKTATNPPAQQEVPAVDTPTEVAQNPQEPDIVETVVSTPQVEEPVPVSPEPVKKRTPKTVAWGTKSFASLLKSPDSAPLSSVPGAPGSKSLTVSTQTGFSVPGAMSLSVDTTSLTPRAHSNILQLLTSGTVAQSSSQGPVEIRPRGLVNTGNMCFANVVLQVLVYSPPFWRLFTELGKYIGNGPVVGSGAQKDGKGTPLTDAVIAFFREFKPPKPSEIAERAQAIKDGEKPDPRRDSFVPSSFYAALRTKSRFDAMRSGHQEDAEEFLGFFLDTLHEELLTLNAQFGGKNEAAGPVANKVSTAADDTSSVAESDVAADDEWQEVGKKNRAMITRTTKTAESAITAIFGGKFRSVLRASGRMDSASVEQWRCLQLDIQPSHVSTIEDALYNIATPETVSMQARHGVPTEATKQMLIESLPPVLILHVKRFVFDQVSGIGKNGKEVVFGPELEIRNDLMSPTYRHGPPAKYKLYGVIYHHGVTANGGHYTLDVLHPNASSVAAGPAGINAPRPGGEGWVRFDDECVRRLKVEEVFGKSPIEERVAYLLFYRRILGTR